MRLRKPIKLFLIVAFVLLVLWLVDLPKIYATFTIDNYQALIDIGYTHQEIASFQTKERFLETDILLNQPYQADALLRITLPYYAQLKDKGYATDEVTALLGLAEDERQLFLESEYHPEWMKWLIVKYTLIDRIERYQNFITKYPQVSIEMTVRKVNANRDRALYTKIEAVDMSYGPLLLVNKYYQLDEDYVPNLAEAKACGGFLMETEAAARLNQLCLDMSALNLDYQISNTYRSYAMQNRIYQNYLAKDSQNIVDSFSARPGHSEHQAGLAVDFKTSSSDITFFENTPAQKWLIKNAHLYGFILRYTEENSMLTGYQAEAWHFRYVGLDVAQALFESELSFDEYWALYLAQ